MLMCVLVADVRGVGKVAQDQGKLPFISVSTAMVESREMTRLIRCGSFSLLILLQIAT